MSTSPTYAADNLTRGTTLAAMVRVAGTSKERRQGLLKSKQLEIGEALWIAPCEAIHTFGMHWPIDVAFLDRQYRIKKLIRALGPRRIAVCFTAYCVLELPAGGLDPTGSQIGDMLAFRSC
jgi:uncharacterized membrane protein (UPF0127 family)